MTWRSGLAILVSAVALLVVISGVMRLCRVTAPAEGAALINTVAVKAVAAASAPLPASASALPMLAASAPAQPAWQALEVQLQQATSLRAFYYAALRDPANGGYFYATRVLADCAAPLPVDAGAAPQRQLATAALRQRCDFSASDLADAQREFKALRNLDSAADPLLAANLDFLRARTAQDKAAVLTRALQQGQPELIAHLVTLALTRDAYLAASLDARATPAYLDYGSELISCYLGADCGEHSALALDLCAHEGVCGRSVADALRTRLGRDFVELERVSQRAVAALRNGKFDHVI